MKHKICQNNLYSLVQPARAVTGRRCPHSGKGEDFLSRQPDFFTETAVTPDRKVQKSNFCHTTPILVNDPFLALGMTVNFPPWDRFFDFPLQQFS